MNGIWDLFRICYICFSDEAELSEIPEKFGVPWPDVCADTKEVENHCYKSTKPVSLREESLAEVHEIKLKQE